MTGFVHHSYENCGIEISSAIEILTHSICGSFSSKGSIGEESLKISLTRAISHLYALVSFSNGVFFSFNSYPILFWIFLRTLSIWLRYSSSSLSTLLLVGLI